MQFHHVQIALLAGQEEEARRFYSDALGLVEVAKPPDLAGRGGCWFRHLDGDTTTLEIHLGVEESLTPAKKAHPAILVDSVRALQDFGDRIEQAGFEVVGPSGARSQGTSASTARTHLATASR